MNRPYDISSYIKNAIILRRSNIIIESFLGLFFKGLNFDKESLALLNNQEKGAKIVFVSYQSTMTSLLIFTRVLRKNKILIPDLALEFSPYFLQLAAGFFFSMYQLCSKLIRSQSFEKITDYSYLENLLQNNKSIVISLLSRKFFFRRYMDIKTDVLSHLIDIQKTSDAPILLYPQIMFWNRNPDRSKMFLTAHATGDYGFLSAIISGLKSFTHPFVRIAVPVNIKEFMANRPGEGTETLSRGLRNHLLEIYNDEKFAVLGPLIKSRQEIMEKVLYHPNVLNAVEQQKTRDHISKEKAKKIAFSSFKEIATDFSIIYIRWFNWVVTTIFRKVFDGIRYSLDDMQMVREAHKKGPVIIVPSHKSHMDYLIVSSTFYMNKIYPPYIASGSNLLFFPMNIIFRHCGAFFMRRSFKGQIIYTAVFKQYIKTIISEGNSIEFFIEGGRTRTGKLQMPKMGFLNYLLEAIDEGYNKDLTFLPATICYNRIIEESSYQEEIQGKEKVSESTSIMIKSMRLLKRKYGTVYLSFNKPFTLQEFKNNSGSNLTSDLADYIMRSINDVNTITPVSLIAAAAIVQTGRAFSRENLAKRLGFFLDYLYSTNAYLSDDLKDQGQIESKIDYVIESFSEDGVIKKIDQNFSGGAAGLEDIYLLNESHRSRIMFYKNAALHSLIPPILVSISLLAESEDRISPKKKAHETCQYLFGLFKHDFVYPEQLKSAESFFQQTVEYFESKSLISLKDDKIIIHENAWPEISSYARLLFDSLESYSIVFDALKRSKRRSEKKELLGDIRKNGLRLYHLGDILFSESMTLPEYESALKKCVEMGIIKESESGKKSISYDIIDVPAAEDMLNRIKSIISKIKP
jgi:glycerol-3-phosphate O-acyltransferase